MKKKNREINIFSMSALDLFASAMGAFLLISVIALPYYLQIDPQLIKQVAELKIEIKKNKAKIETLQKSLKECQESKEKTDIKVAQLEKENKQLKKDLAKAQKEAKEAKSKSEKMQKELSKTFCVITMQWKSQEPKDIDLHIIDHRGEEYYYAKQTHRGSEASLTVDAGSPTKVKKGAEVWVSKELKEGTYIIKYKYYSGSGVVSISGSVFSKSFTKDLPLITNMHNGEKRVIAKIIVDANGEASLEEN